MLRNMSLSSVRCILMKLKRPSTVSLFEFYSGLFRYYAYSGIIQVLFRYIQVLFRLYSGCIQIYSGFSLYSGLFGYYSGIIQVVFRFIQIILFMLCSDCIQVVFKVLFRFLLDAYLYKAATFWEVLESSF